MTTSPLINKLIEVLPKEMTFEDCVRQELIIANIGKTTSQIHQDAHNAVLRKVIASLPALIEVVRKEVAKAYVGWQDRSDNRDHSYDDAFLDGTEVMQEKILSLLK